MSKLPSTGTDVLVIGRQGSWNDLEKRRGVAEVWVMVVDFAKMNPVLHAEACVKLFHL